MLRWKYLCLGAIPLVAVAVVALTEPTEEKVFGALGISVIALVLRPKSRDAFGIQAWSTRPV
jgi:hypothetical protein